MMLSQMSLMIAQFPGHPVPGGKHQSLLHLNLAWHMMQSTHQNWPRPLP